MRVIVDLVVIGLFLAAIVLTGAWLMRAYNRYAENNERLSEAARIQKLQENFERQKEPQPPQQTAESESPQQIQGQLEQVEKNIPTIPAQDAPKESLSREDVVQGLSLVKQDVKLCGHGEGLLIVELLIGEDGKVESVKAVDDHVGTPLETCAVSAISRARFPRSSRSLRVKYPFKL